MGGKVKKTKKKESGTEIGNAATVDEVINQLLADNPGMNAATFCNTLKAKGISFVMPTADAKAQAKDEEKATSQADSASTNAPATRAGVAKVDPVASKDRRQATSIRFRSSRIMERAASDDGIGPTKFRTVLIQEGMGNFGSCFYYTKDALKSGIAVFEGKKIYADHPSTDEEQTRPERSVRDVLGYFENVSLEEGEDGHSLLCADVKILDESQYAWARGLMRHAVEYSKKYPDKDLVGLSINASGDSDGPQSIEEMLKDPGVPSSARLKLEKALAEGIKDVRLVHNFTEAVSCDLVTEAGAGGRISALIEEEKKMAKAQKKDEVVDKKEETKETKDIETKEKDEAMGDEDGDADAGHSDVDKDKELIKRMLDQHIGEGDHSEADMAAASEAYQAACAMGMEGEEAMKCAGMYMKMNKHMKAKTETKGEPCDTDQPEKHPAGGAESEESKEEAKEESKEEPVPTDPKEAELLQLRGENAGLKEKVRKIELDSHLDKKLKESGLSNRVTKEIREGLGSVKSEREIDEKIELFMKGYKSGGRSESFFVTETEKSEAPKLGSSFADCVRN